MLISRFIGLVDVGFLTFKYIFIALQATLALGCLAASNCLPGHHGVSAISNNLHGPGCC